MRISIVPPSPKEYSHQESASSVLNIFSGFRIDFKMSVRDGIFSKCLFSTKLTRIQKLQTSAKCATHSATRLPHLESEYFQSLQKRRSNENLLHGRNSSYSSCEVPDILFVVNVVGHFMLSLWYFVVERYGPHQSDTRNFLLKCRHSILSMIRYDAAAGHVVLVDCHHYSFSAAFNDSGLLLLFHS